MHFLRLFACFVALSIAAQTPDVASNLARQANPVLLILAAAEPKAPKPLTSRELMETDGLEELVLWSLVPDPKNPRSVELNRAYRAHLGLPEASWALLAPGGACVASGAIHLDRAGLKDILETARIQTPIQKLQAFLRRRPDHLEARQKLLARLRGIAAQRTRLALGDATHRKPLPAPDSKQVVALRDTLPKPGTALTPQQDLRIWGSLYLELSRAYQSGDWLAMDLPPNFYPGFSPYFQPSTFPIEAASPLMKGLFRWHRPTLLATLREVPEDLNVLHHWLWTSLVLEEPLLPVFEKLKAPSPEAQQFNGGRRWPGEHVQRALAAEAAANGDWTRLRRVLVARWLDGADVRRWNRGSSRVSPDLEQWEEVGLPALEACLRSGAPQEAGPILDGAMEAKEAAALLDQAVELAQRLGFQNVAQDWRGWTPKPPAPEILWSHATAFRTSKTPGNLEIVLSNEASGPRVTINERPIRLHPDDPQRSRLADDWRRFLGWGPHELRWAVLDPKGRTLLQGFEPMDEKAVTKELEGLNLPKPGEEYLKRRAALQAQSADSPWLRLKLTVRDLPEFLASLLSTMQMSRTRVEPGKQPDPDRDGSLKPSIDLERLKRMEPDREEGLWKRAGWLADTGWYGPPQKLPVSGAESTARPWVEALEAALIRKPTRSNLWNFWGQWMTLLPDHPVQPFLDSLELDPLARRFDTFASFEDVGIWPPDQVLEVMTNQAQASGHWDSMGKTLRSIWAEDLQNLEKLTNTSQTGRPYQASWIFRHSGLRLAHALLQQDRPEEADKILEEALQAGLRSRREASQMAASIGSTELAKRWDPPATDTKDKARQP